MYGGGVRSLSKETTPPADGRLNGAIKEQWTADRLSLNEGSECNASLQRSRLVAVAENKRNMQDLSSQKQREIVYLTGVAAVDQVKGRI